jgi:hypothetical protein
VGGTFENQMLSFGRDLRFDFFGAREKELSNVGQK